MQLEIQHEMQLRCKSKPPLLAAPKMGHPTQRWMYHLRMQPTGSNNRQDYPIPLSQNDWLPGNVFSARGTSDEYVIAKILGIDSVGVHIRLYKEKFFKRPVLIQTSTLTLGSINDNDGFGFGHLPIVRELFASWEPVLITTETLEEEELEGYKMWSDHNGGYFSSL
jgi:hypothetical protein